MGMTIDEIVENLITIRNKLCSRKYETESTLTFDGAITVMRKYQKIEQIIMDDWYKGYQHSETIQRIKEVMKNGNNNTDDKLQD